MAISSAVSPGAVARVVGIETVFKNLRAGNAAILPQNLMVVAQGATAATYSTDKRQVFSAFEAGSLYGFGSPIHLAVKELLPVSGDGVGSIPVIVYPLEDAPGAVTATWTITPTGTQSGTAAYVVYVNEIPSEAFTVEDGELGTDLEARIAAAINAALDLPVTAAAGSDVVDVTAKWGGASANGIQIEVRGPANGITFTVAVDTAGATNPDVQDALDQVGDVWQTMCLNCLEIADTDALDTYSAFGEGRWDALTRKPLVVFTGNTEADVSTAVAIPDARTTDRVNCQLVAPGSKNLPFVVAARQLARIAVVADSNPPKDYGSKLATGLVPGTDAEQWNAAQREAAVKAGSSTVKIVGGVVAVSDVITFYKPSGDPVPAYRFVVDIVKLQNIIFNLDLIFANDEWDGAPLIPDDQATVNPAAKQPKAARAAVAAMIDSLAANAIISDPVTAKATIQVEIDSGNPKRLNIAVTVQLSGNANIISITLNFGFYFGTVAAA